MSILNIDSCFLFLASHIYYVPREQQYNGTYIPAIWRLLSDGETLSIHLFTTCCFLP